MLQLGLFGCRKGTDLLYLVGAEYGFLGEAAVETLAPDPAAAPKQAWETEMKAVRIQLKLLAAVYEEHNDESRPPSSWFVSCLLCVPEPIRPSPAHGKALLSVGGSPDHTHQTIKVSLLLPPAPPPGAGDEAAAR